MASSSTYNLKEKAKFYSWVSLFGGLRTCIGILAFSLFLIGFPLEQPFEVAKTIWQAEPYRKNEVELVKSIHSRYGLKGFYKGGIANCVRVATKSLYRYPLVLFFQSVFDQLFPGMETNSRTLTIVKGLSALCVANAESVIVCPLERLKVFFMTRTVFSGGYFHYLKANSRKLRRELFRGLWIHMLRQNVSWLVWLETDAWTKMYVRKKYNINPFEKSIPFKMVLPLAFFTSIINVLAVMPFDMIKTNMQKETPENAKEMVAKYANKMGIKYFFVGWRIRLIQYCIQNIFTMNMLEGMETRYRKIKQKYGLSKH